jgi:C4-type Zn-finger protein
VVYLQVLPDSFECEALKCCPLCGAQVALGIEEEDPFIDKMGCVTIGCIKCGLRLPDKCTTFWSKERGPWSDTKGVVQKIVAAWNTRV